MRRFTITLSLLLAATAACTSTDDDLDTGRQGSPKIKDETGTSTNWSGYAVDGAAGSITDVSGSWVVPAVTGPAAKKTKGQYSSFWVGIDGDNSNTVEQTGTDSDWINGAPVYYAWYEFYPAASKNIDTVSVHPGDVMTASVHWSSGSSFTLTLTNTTTNETFVQTGSVSSAQRSSAEWIAEAPAGGGILPLADFGTIDFTNCTANGQAIGSYSSTAIQQIDMATKRGVAKANTSGLGTDGESFSVDWASTGP
jgi:hypothetical protein